MMNRQGQIWCVSLLLVVILLLSQCSQYTGKGLLNFFFDGVPVADSSGVTETDSSLFLADSSGMEIHTLETDGPVMFVHYPYQERECEACHDRSSLGSMVEPEPGLCYLCHDDLGMEYKYLHGPVAGGYCTACHQPHMAKEEKLLRYTGQELCFHCHNETSVYQNEMHQDLGGMTCMDCHNPHGGEDKYILN